MRRIVHSVELIANKRTPVEALMYRDEPHWIAETVEREWAWPRRLLAAVRWLKRKSGENSHWDWSLKLSDDEHGPRRLFSIVHFETQALMSICKYLRPSRLVPGEQLVYIDYLEGAPWNQEKLPFRNKFGGAGVAMLREAIAVSHECGAGGRIALHSLPQSEGFYQRAGMKYLHHDVDYQNLPYYEYVPAQGDYLSRQEGAT